MANKENHNVYDPIHLAWMVKEAAWLGRCPGLAVLPDPPSRQAGWGHSRFAFHVSWPAFFTIRASRIGSLFAFRPSGARSALILFALLLLTLGGCKKNTGNELTPLATLEEEMQSPDADVRCVAVRQLKWLAPKGTEAIPLLIKALADKDGAVRYEAAEGIDQFGSAAAQAVPALIAALGDHEPEVKVAAAHALGTMGPAGIAAMSALETAARDANPEVREAAAKAIKSIKVVLEYNRTNPKPDK